MEEVERRELGRKLSDAAEMGAEGGDRALVVEVGVRAWAAEVVARETPVVTPYGDLLAPANERFACA